MASAPKTPPRPHARNLMQATSPEHVPEKESARNMYQAHNKKKRFSIKGLLGGESKKERKTRQSSEVRSGNQSGAGQISPEAETVYQVDVDDRTMSVMSEQSKVQASNSEKAAAGFLSGASAKTYMLKVVLLLMDPETRRFELLQLEFDSDKALVSDVLTQIPVAVTEAVLKRQTYVGISGSSGTQMNSSVLLSEFCRGNDVLVAVPSGIEADECARLARPILNDDKVINMLKASGIDASAWKEVPVPVPAPTTTSRALPEAEPKKEIKEESGGGAFSLVIMVLFAILLQVYHSKITAPIAPGQVLSPGGWVSRCGIASALPICDNEYMYMGTEGVLSLFDANGELEWKMEGGVCSTEDCVEGLEMKEDNRVLIGGKLVSWVNVKKDAKPISPWPFADEPKVKVIHGRK